MGDHRLSVEMTLVGADGKQRKREMYVNWSADRPRDVIKTLIELSEESQLDAEWPQQWEED
tara:strand:+ start:1113 stop:1295 length:183 start_codon:yes stop_codon:yes gene_type:complete